MTVRLVHEGLPSDITPYRLKLLLRRARIALGLSKGAVEYLVFAIENCQPSDFQNGGICAIWHSLERLATLFGVSKRQINRIEAELVEAGLIKRTYPERKSRYGDRVDGVIKRASLTKYKGLRNSRTRMGKKSYRTHLGQIFGSVASLAMKMVI